MRQARLLTAMALGAIIAALSAADAQSPPARQTSPTRQTPPAAHGDPQGWRFKLPPGGSASRGRAVFDKFECHRCHEVRGETFARPSQRDALGPELSSMARHHSAAFLAESIVNPGAYVDKKHGNAAADGSSRMPSFNDAMTIQDLADVVTYLQSLSAPAAPATAPGGHRH